MHKVTIAEWLLSLVPGRASAASITGDLMERREPWFWFSVIRTVFSFSMRDLAADPGSFTLLALKGFGFLLLWQVSFLLHDRDAPFTICLMAYVAVSQFLVGRAIARRASQHELSAWLALPIFILAGSSGWKAIPYSLAWFALYQIPAFTGAALVRRREARHA